MGTNTNTEKQMAEALLWIVKEFGDDFTNEYPQGCALIMEAFIAGQDSCHSHITELKKTIDIQDASIEVISDSIVNIEAENKKMKEALEKIANCDYHPDKCIQEFTENLLYIASEALQNKIK